MSFCRHAIYSGLDYLYNVHSALNETLFNAFLSQVIDKKKLIMFKNTGKSKEYIHICINILIFIKNDVYSE